MSPAARYALIAAGTLATALGLIGIFVPVLPTTPFLLLAAALYARSSQRFYTWLTTNRLFGSYLRNYREGRGIPLPHKVVTIALLWLTILLTAFLALPSWPLRALLLAVACGVTWHLARVKTRRR